MDWDLEQAAERVLDESDQGGCNVRVAIVAKRLGLKVMDGGPGCQGVLFGNEIIVDDSLPRPRWNFDVGHEIGHYDARRSGRRDTEWGASYFASALMLPRQPAQIEFRRSGWDLLKLMSRFRHASGEAIARRIVALEGARAIIFDRPEGQEEKSYCVPYRSVPTQVEREAAALAFETGAPVHDFAGVYAFPLFQEGWRRVIVISDPDSAACANRRSLY